MISAIILLYESRQNQKSKSQTYAIDKHPHSFTYQTQASCFCHFAIHTTASKDNTFTTNIQIKHPFYRKIPTQDGKKATKKALHNPQNNPAFHMAYLTAEFLSERHMKDRIVSGGYKNYGISLREIP